MDRIEQLFEATPDRWPETREMGNGLRLSENGLGILDDRFGGEVNRYSAPPTDAELVEELDCQEQALKMCDG